MPRYIDADALKHELCIRQHMLNANSLWKTLEIMDAQPTADAVEAIRCKDCMWYEIYQLKKDGTDDRRHKPSFCTLYNRLCDPDWFCADGMREIEK